jgi:hypothetical protein
MERRRARAFLIRRALEIRKWKATDLARAVGRDGNTVRRWANGTTAPPVTTWCIWPRRWDWTPTIFSGRLHHRNILWTTHFVARPKQGYNPVVRDTKPSEMKIGVRGRLSYASLELSNDGGGDIFHCVSVTKRLSSPRGRAWPLSHSNRY